MTSFVTGFPMSISERMANLYDMIDMSFSLVQQGKYAEADDLYIKCYTTAYDLLSKYDDGFFSQEELDFMNTIISEFEHE